MKTFLLLLSVRFKQAIRRASSRASMWLSLAMLLILLGPFSLLGAYWLHQFLSTDTFTPESLAVIIEIGFAVYVLYAMFSPFFGLNASDYLDIEKARLYPIRPTSLFGVALVSGMFTPMMAFLTPSIVVALRHLAPTVPAFLFNMGIFGLFLVFTSGTRQCVTLAFLNLLKRRRYQDLLRVLVPFTGIVIFAGIQFLVYGDPQEVTRQLESIEIPPWIRDTPFFWHARSLISSEELGLGFLLRVLLAMIATVAVLALGSALLKRAMAGEMESGANRAVAETWEEEAGLRRVTKGGSRGAIWGMAAKEFRLIRREPAIKTLIIQQSFLFLFPILILLAQSRFDMREMVENGGRIMLPTLLILLYVEFQVFYFALGFEGKSLLQLVSQPIQPNAIFIGKNLVYGTVGLVWNTLVVVGLCALFQQPQRIVPYSLAGGFGLIVALGWANLSSTLFPVPLSTTGRNPLSQSTNNRRGCMLAIWTYLNVGLLLVFSAPIVGVVAARMFERESSPATAAVLAALMGAYSLGLYLLFLIIAASLFRKRQEQILDLFIRQSE